MNSSVWPIEEDENHTGEIVQSFHDSSEGDSAIDSGSCSLGSGNLADENTDSDPDSLVSTDSYEGSQKSIQPQKRDNVDGCFSICKRQRSEEHPCSEIFLNHDNGTVPLGIQLTSSPSDEDEDSYNHHIAWTQSGLLSQATIVGNNRSWWSALNSTDKLVELNGSCVEDWSHDILVGQFPLLSESFQLTVQTLYQGNYIDVTLKITKRPSDGLCIIEILCIREAINTKDIIDVKLEDQHPHYFHIQSVCTNDFLKFEGKDLISAELIKSDYKFAFEVTCYGGNDTEQEGRTVFMWICANFNPNARTADKMQFISVVDRDKGIVRVQTQKPYKLKKTIKKPDPRFFNVHRIEGLPKRIVFESMICKGFYLACNKQGTFLKPKKILNDCINDSEVLFNTWDCQLAIDHKKSQKPGCYWVPIVHQVAAGATGVSEGAWRLQDKPEQCSGINKTVVCEHISSL